VTPLLGELQALGVSLFLDGDRLRYRARKGVMTPQLLARLSTRKAELLALATVGVPDNLTVDEAEEFDERVAICVYDGGLSEQDAVQVAVEQIMARRRAARTGGG
jgi:hypothetical protein